MAGAKTLVAGKASTMTRCTICRHGEREKIEEGLLEGRTLRELERRYGVSKSALLRHRDGHLAARMAAGAARRQEGEAEAGEEMWGRLKWMQGRTTSLVLRTERKRPRVAIEALRQLGRLWMMEQRARQAAASERRKAGGSGGCAAVGRAAWARVAAEALREHPEAERALLEAAERWAREASGGEEGV